MPNTSGIVMNRVSRHPSAVSPEPRRATVLAGWGVPQLGHTLAVVLTSWPHSRQGFNGTATIPANATEVGGRVLPQNRNASRASIISSTASDGATVKNSRFCDALNPCSASRAWIHDSAR